MLKKFFTRTWSGLLRSAFLGSVLLVSTLLIASVPMQASAANVVNSNFEAYFNNFNSSLWESATWANGNPFNCTWRQSQVTFKNGKMVLTIDKDSGGSYPYKGGEYRTTQFFGFGYYEVRMKAIKNTGVVSSFFTYTGPSDNNPWDEIDIEFLGKNTTQVQFNWYKNGSANNEYMYNLGFDASQAFHTYGFEWRSSYIDYYVDGKKVYRGTRNIPQTPSKIMMNVWPGIGVNDWLQAYDGRTPLSAEYEYVKYFPNGVPSSGNPTPTRTNAPTPTKAPATVVKSDFSANFSNFNTSLWESASWANGNPFNCTWKPSQVTFNNGKMVLTIDRDSGGSYPYKGGEYRTTQFFGFGYYEVRMKAIKNTGVVSSFFTYTGPSDNNPWDEIDIEFLGKNTTQVQFNWYKNGSANNEYMYNLGFDASQAFHTYGFEWRSSYIDYYVDGKKVYRGTRNIPQTPGKIMMNVWPGVGVDGWLGYYDGRTPLSAEYEYVKYSPNSVPSSSNPTQNPTQTPYQPNVLVGDVNGDGSINSIDFGHFRMYLIGTINDFPVANDLKAADLDGSGSINSIDFGYMRQFLLGMINRFPAS